MQIQNKLKRQPVLRQKAVEQEMTYIPINETQELIEKLVYLTNNKAIIVPMKFWRNIQLSI